MSLPEGPAGRRLALALLAGALLVLWAGVAQPLADWYAARALAIESRAAQIQRLAPIAAELPVLRRAAHAVGSPDERAPVLLSGASDALAGAQLVALVGDAAREAGAAVRSVEILPAVGVDGHRRLGVRLAAEGTLDDVVRLLRRLQGLEALVLVDNLSLRAADARGAGGGSAAPGLSLGVDVFAFRRA